VTLKKTSILCALILLLVGLLCWRESKEGFLRNAERSLAIWVASASADQTGVSLAPPTLVFQGGMDGKQLSALDIGLFARASRKLAAKVIGSTTYEFPRSEVSLEMRAGDQTHPAFVAGTLLMKREARAGLPPVTLTSLDPQIWKIENFPGSFSGFFAGSGWHGGFLNLPSQAEQAGRFPVLARLENTIVASFPLAAFLASIPGLDPAKITGSPAGGLKIGSWVLPVAADGSLPLNISLLGSLRRVDMDDVLVNVERLDRGDESDPDVASLFEGQTVLLGTLGAISGEPGIRLDTGRQFSLVEFQGLALASLQDALFPSMLPWWGDILCIFAAVGMGLLIFQVHPSRRLWLTTGLLAGWMLFAISFYSSGGSLPPLISPLSILVIAFIISPLLDFRRSNTPGSN